MNFTIPPQITEICDGVFYSCKKLEKVEIPENSQLREIGIGSFSLSGIKQIKIPKNVTQICYRAFANCYDLQRIEFNPDSELQKIKKFAFHCTSIQSISLPPKLTKIGANAFFVCPNIQIIEMDEFLQIINPLQSDSEVLIMIPNKKDGTF